MVEAMQMMGSGMGMGTAASVGMGLWMVLWALVGLAFLVLAVAGTVWLLRNPRPTKQNQEPAAAEDVLRRRYAAGEVDDDEYLRRMAGLNQ